jgi:outer membrane cobalamin receptor
MTVLPFADWWPTRAIISDGIRNRVREPARRGNLSLYDLLSIERVEVLKGPGSVMYGTDAFGEWCAFLAPASLRDAFGISSHLKATYDGARNTWMTGAGRISVTKMGLTAGYSMTRADDPSLPNNTAAEEALS